LAGRFLDLVVQGMNLKDRAATLVCEDELTGFIAQLKHEGRFDRTAENICEMRRAEIKRGQK